MSVIISQPIHCKLSGVRIATLEFLTTAGTVPYLQAWGETICYHPVFGMDMHKVLSLAHAEWKRIAEIDEPESVDSTVLRVCYLALLHSLDSVKQDSPALPPFEIVQSTMPGLFNLAAWKFHLESKRFRFPTLHISEFNKNTDFSNIRDYISLCFDIKEDYETKVSEAVEKEKVLAAERAMQALKNTWIAPTSKKMLFQWVRAHLPEKYHPDAQGWLGTIFLGSDATVLEFTNEDLELAEEIILSSCPPGTGVLFAVRKRLEHLKTVWSQHYEAWEIMDDDDTAQKIFVNGERIATPHPGEEPKEKAFEKRWQFIQAHAKWTIAMGKWNKENGK
jgi:hypothetical protein